MGSVQKRILTGTTLALFVGGLLLLHERTPAAWGGIVAWATALVLSWLGAGEVARMPGYHDLRLGGPLRIALLLVAACTWWARAGIGGFEGEWAGLALGGLVAVLLAAGLRRRSWRLASSFALWSVVPLFGLVPLDRLYGTRGLLILILLSKVGDIFGYFVGRAIGKSHPFPKLSPGKTVAGCVASLLSAVGTGALLGLSGALPGVDSGWWAGLAAGLLVNLASQGGDLLESKVKRIGAVKDSGTLFGAAGGVLDVVDSLLLSLPVALIFWPWFLVV